MSELELRKLKDQANEVLTKICEITQGFIQKIEASHSEAEIAGNLLLWAEKIKKDLEV